MYVCMHLLFADLSSLPFSPTLSPYFVIWVPGIRSSRGLVDVTALNVRGEKISDRISTYPSDGVHVRISAAGVFRLGAFRRALACQPACVGVVGGVCVQVGRRMVVWRATERFQPVT